MTGNVVNAALTPGKCAAPPAPAMMTHNPRSRAPLTYCSRPCGSRCADITRASQVIPNSLQTSAAAFIVGQSESLPIRMPTSAFEDVDSFMNGSGYKEPGKLGKEKNAV